MSALITTKAGPVQQVPADLGGKLMWLRRYGKPTLGVYGACRGWHAGIEMAVSAVGAEFKIASEFNHETPEAAVDTLIGRMLKTLEQLQG